MELGERINYMKKNYSVALMVDQRVSEGEDFLFLKTCSHNYIASSTST